MHSTILNPDSSVLNSMLLTDSKIESRTTALLFCMLAVTKFTTYFQRHEVTQIFMISFLLEPWSHEASDSRERPARVIALKSGHTGRVTRPSFKQRVTLPRGSY